MIPKLKMNMIFIMSKVGVLNKIIKKGMYWYKKTALKNNTYGLDKLGYLYAKGLGVRQDYAKAKAIYEKSGSNYSLKRLENMRKERLIK